MADRRCSHLPSFRTETRQRRTKWGPGDAYRVGPLLSGSHNNAPERTQRDTFRDLERDLTHVQRKLAQLKG